MAAIAAAQKKQAQQQQSQSQTQTQQSQSQASSSAAATAAAPAASKSSKPANQSGMTTDRPENNTYGPGQPEFVLTGSRTWGKRASLVAGPSPAQFNRSTPARANSPANAWTAKQEVPTAQDA